MENLFEEKELPLAELQKIGLYRDGRLAIEEEDIQAMLSGRRTDLISIRDLRTDAFHILKLDARISLQRNADRSVTLNLHPIYRQTIDHSLLNKQEAEDLISGKLDKLYKEVPLDNGKRKPFIVEYDPQTREFISYSPDRVQVPEAVNGQRLSPEDRHRYRMGQVLELDDGTRLQHRASERKGLLSNRQALVLSVLLDGGISYLLVTGIRNLMGSKEVQPDPYTQGYQQALKEMQESKQAHLQDRENPVFQPQEALKNEQSRGYGRRNAR